MKYEQPYGVSDTDASYINGNPSTGTMGSIPPAASIENPQREIVNFITDAHLVPADTDLHQLGRGVQSNGVVYCDDQGTVNQLAITLSPPVTVLTKGMVFIVKSPISNTGPSTLKVNALAPVPIVRATDQAPLQLGDISPNALLAYGYDGAKFQMVWTQRQPGAPIYLTAPQTYYVNKTTGSDSYDGQSASVASGHGPFQTVQKACNQIPLYNMNGFSITINVADGTYNSFVVPPQNGSGTIYIYGNVTIPGNVPVFGNNVSSIVDRSGGDCFISGFTVANSGPTTPSESMSGVWCLNAGTRTYLDAMGFGTCTGPQICVQLGAAMTNTTAHSKWTISGSASAFLQVAQSSSFQSNSFGGPDITVSGPVNYSGAFVACSISSSVIFVYGALIGGASVAGVRYNVNNNSVIGTGGGGANYYPGTLAGVSAQGGYYS
jgi:hypothetical protein